MQDFSALFTAIAFVLSAITASVVVIVSLKKGKRIEIDLNKDGKPDIVIPEDFHDSQTSDHTRKGD